MNIEPATPADLSRLGDIWEAAVRATHDFLTEHDIDFFRPLVREGYLPGAAHLAVARGEDGQALGFVGVDGDLIETLFVDPVAHRRGVGAALLQYAIVRWAACRVDVNEQNPGALAFYRRMGFEIASRSQRDGLGKPFPLLHLRRAATVVS